MLLWEGNTMIIASDFATEAHDYRGEAIYISMIDFQWFFVRKEMVLNCLIIHHLIMITCISHEIIFTISLPKLINIASIKHV